MAKKEEKKKLRILNPAELAPLVGGKDFKCNKTGDTIACAPLVADVTVCVSFEASCPSGFSSKCNLSSKIDIVCPSGFSVGH